MARNRVLAFMCALGVSLAWVAEMLLIQHVQSPANPHEHASKPLFLTWFTRSGQALLLLVWWWRRPKGGHKPNWGQLHLWTGLLNVCNFLCNLCHALAVRYIPV